ncbi:DUF6686 family protein [Sediminibacterium soli]|uniref:DUF6686 family protein n=1 Tax=Sediminibacterium soli TaxID=2698829 RepID=UPI00137A9A41|nr:DUF6686 family protein [Sediminibacterium soli]NCI47328.1 hypothetical protein [Sediminibacterium soli]
MCQYHTWFRDEEKGFVIECRNCRKLQLAFGMVMVRFAENEFHSFRRYIASKREEFEGTDNRTDKTILLQTPCESLNFLFSYEELENLHLMLEQADTEMKTEKMLRLFQEQPGN